MSQKIIKTVINPKKDLALFIPAYSIRQTCGLISDLVRCSQENKILKFDNKGKFINCSILTNRVNKYEHFKKLILLCVCSILYFVTYAKRFQNKKLGQWYN